MARGSVAPELTGVARGKKRAEKTCDGGGLARTQMRMQAGSIPRGGAIAGPPFFCQWLKNGRQMLWGFCFSRELIQLEKKKKKSQYVLRQVSVFLFRWGLHNPPAIHEGSLV